MLPFSKSQTSTAQCNPTAAATFTDCATRQRQRFDRVPAQVLRLVRRHVRRGRRRSARGDCRIEVGQRARRGHHDPGRDRRPTRPITATATASTCHRAARRKHALGRLQRERGRPARPPVPALGLPGPLGVRRTADGGWTGGLRASRRLSGACTGCVSLGSEWHCSSEQPPPRKGATAGYYPDPLGSGRGRYWDGHTWTDAMVGGARSRPTPQVEPCPASRRTSVCRHCGAAEPTPSPRPLPELRQELHEAEHRRDHRHHRRVAAWRCSCCSRGCADCCIAVRWPTRSTTRSTAPRDHPRASSTRSRSASTRGVRSRGSLGKPLSDRRPIPTRPASASTTTTRTASIVRASTPSEFCFAEGVLISKHAGDVDGRLRSAEGRPYTGSAVKKVLILGSTGSIGTQALEVDRRSGDELSGRRPLRRSSWEPLLEQARITACPRSRWPTRRPPPSAARRGEDACSPAKRGSAS